MFVLALLGEILGGILAGLLVWGAVKKRRNFLLPWIIFAAVVMIGTLVTIITCVVILPIGYGITFLIVGILELRKLALFSSMFQILTKFLLFSRYDLLLASSVQLLPAIARKRSHEHKLSCRNEAPDNFSVVNLLFPMCATKLPKCRLLILYLSKWPLRL